MINAVMTRYLTEYAAIFGLLLIVAYVIPAGIFYWLFFVRRNESTEAMRIQERRHTTADVRREITGRKRSTRRVSSSLIERVQKE